MISTISTYSRRKTRLLLSCSVTVLALAAPNFLFAYEVPLHEYITGLAVKDSRMSDAGYLEELGAISPHGDAGITLITDDQNKIGSRSASRDKRLQYNLASKFIMPYSARYGANREDATLPYPRSANHFYDPQNQGIGYPFGDPVVARPSPTWMLEPNGDIFAGDISFFLSIFGISTDGSQDYSLRDGLEYYREAVTSAEAAVRDENWGNTFRVMGHLVHHIQDMAQPQHTRTDNHCSHPVACLSKYNPSAYEHFSFSGVNPVTNGVYFEEILTSNALKYPALDLNDFQNPEKFWGYVTGDSRADGKGLAEYSTNNYVSAGTNYTFNGFNGSYTVGEHPPEMLSRILPHDLPSGSDATITFLPSASQLKGIGVIGAISAPTIDTNNPAYSDTNDLASTITAFAPMRVFSDLTATMNSLNYVAQMTRLLPRARTYSTGFIDYFFRGRLSVDQINFTNKGVGTLQVKNVSGQGDAFTFDNGNFRMFVEAIDGERTEVMLTSGAVSTWDFNQTQQLSFNLNLSPAAGQLAPKFENAGKIVLFYDGMIGNSEGLATHVFYRPSLASYSLPAAAGGTTQHKVAFEQDYVQLDDLPVQGGFIDWKGAYQNNGNTSEATKQLSYLGPKSRVMGIPEYGNSIYRDGVEVFRAPDAVIGAALTVDSLGQEWIIAATLSQDQSTETVYRKRSDKGADYSTALYDAATPEANPNGWQIMGSFNLPNNSLVYGPWFFNGDGTKAVTLRRDKELLPFSERDCERDINGFCVPGGFAGYPADDYEVTVLGRYELSIQGNSATRNYAGFETGDTAVLAVDYLDNELLELRSFNIQPPPPPNGTGGIPDIAPENLQFLEINGDVVFDFDIINCQRLNEMCRGVRNVAFSTQWDGIANGWTSRFPTGDIESVGFHITFADLRTRTFEYSKITLNYTDNGEFESTGTAEYFLMHNGADPVELLSVDSATPEDLVTGFAMSNYGEEAETENLIDPYLPPIRGQYQFFNIDFSVAPLLEESGAIVTKNGEVLATGKHPNGESYNYFSGLSNGELAGLAGVGLDGETVLSIGRR